VRSFSSILIVAMSFSLWSYATGQSKICEAAKILPPGSPPQNMSVYTEPPFHVEVERDRKDGTRFILTNWYQLPLAAYVEEITPVPDGQEGGVQHGFHVVDDLIRNGGLLAAIPQNLSTINAVSHNQGRADAQPSIAAVCGMTVSPTVPPS